MEEKIFEYGGYHFIPERELTKEEVEQYTRFVPGKMSPEDKFGPYFIFPHKYSWREFYEKSTDRAYGLYLCLEDGKLYVPTTHGLQVFLESSEVVNEKNSLYQPITIEVKKETTLLKTLWLSEEEIQKIKNGNSKVIEKLYDELDKAQADDSHYDYAAYDDDGRRIV